jgi:signal transduction histidine kinase
MSSISHELRTPLTAISGWGETLMYDENQSEESKKGLAIILKESHRLTKMVEELLEFTRMQDGRFTLNAEMIDVGAELEETIFSYREVLRQYNMSLEYDPCMQDLPMIYADPERLRQVFLNILDNANKYGRDGGRIVVSVRLDASYITVRFRDFGPGIPEDQLDHVKEKFFKGDNTKRGSGIGLAVCDEIINYHGGSLTLANANGGGCLVTIRLPIKMTVREDNPDDRQ